MPIGDSYGGSGFLMGLGGGFSNWQFAQWFVIIGLLAICVSWAVHSGSSATTIASTTSPRKKAPETPVTNGLLEMLPAARSRVGLARRPLYS